MWSSTPSCAMSHRHDQLHAWKIEVIMSEYGYYSDLDSGTSFSGENVLPNYFPFAHAVLWSTETILLTSISHLYGSVSCMIISVWNVDCFWQHIHHTKIHSPLSINMGFFCLVIFLSSFPLKIYFLFWWSDNCLL